MEIVYSSMATQRREAFRLQTQILQDGEHKIARKIAMADAAKEHLKTISNNYQALRKSLTDEIDLCACDLHETYIDFEYVEGEAFADRVYNAYRKGGFKAAGELFLKYKEFLNTCCNTYTEFEYSSLFKRIFGAIDHVGKKCMIPCDIDLSLSNVMIRNGRYAVIDYEWMFPVTVPVEFVLFRGLNHYYCATDTENRNDIENMFEYLGISKEQIELYYQMEYNFGNYVHDLYGMEKVFIPYVKEQIPILDIRLLNEGLELCRQKVQQAEQAISQYDHRIVDYEQRIADYEHRIADYEFRITNYSNEVESWKQEYAKLQNMPVKGHMKQIAKRMLKRK